MQALRLADGRPRLVSLVLLAGLCAVLWPRHATAQWDVGAAEETAAGATPGPAPTAASSSVAPPPPASPVKWAELAAKSELEQKLEQARALATKLTASLEPMKKRGMLAQGQVNRYADQIKAWEGALEVIAEQVASVKAEFLDATTRETAAQTAAAELAAAKDATEEQRAALDEKAKAARARADAAKGAADASKKSALAGVAAAKTGLLAIGSELTALENATGWNLVGTLLRARCATAICFDNGAKKDWLGIEPLVELPLGTSFALSNSALADYVNNHDIRVDLAAGARVWLFRDVVSVSMYISKPLSDAPVRLEGSKFVYPASSVRRPYPGFALGLLFDSIWVGFDRDELRNGDGQDTNAVNSDFPPNVIVSSTWSLTVAIQPVTAFRSAIGSAVQASKEGGK